MPKPWRHFSFCFTVPRFGRIRDCLSQFLDLFFAYFLFIKKKKVRIKLNGFLFEYPTITLSGLTFAHCLSSRMFLFVMKLVQQRKIKALRNAETLEAF